MKYRICAQMDRAAIVDDKMCDLQSVAKRVEWHSFKVAVGSVGHCVVGDCRYLRR